MMMMMMMIFAIFAMQARARSEKGLLRRPREEEKRGRRERREEERKKGRERRKETEKKERKKGGQEKCWKGESGGCLAESKSSIITAALSRDAAQLSNALISRGMSPHVHQHCQNISLSTPSLIDR